MQAPGYNSSNNMENAGQNLGPIQIPGSDLGNNSKPLFPKTKLLP